MTIQKDQLGSEHLAIEKAVEIGESQKKYGSAVVFGNPVVYYAIIDLIETQFNHKPCLVLCYLKEKLTLLGW